MVEDVDGNRFLDFMSGIAVSSTGYGHPKVVAAVQEAAANFLHICGSDFYFEGMAALAERLDIEVVASLRRAVVAAAKEHEESE